METSRQRTRRFIIINIIGVSIYILVRFEKKIENLNKSISDLTTVIIHSYRKTSKIRIPHWYSYFLWCAKHAQSISEFYYFEIFTNIAGKK